jgi:hypothetical protein
VDRTSKGKKKTTSSKTRQMWGTDGVKADVRHRPTFPELSAELRGKGRPGQTKAPVVIRGSANASWYAAYHF